MLRKPVSPPQKYLAGLCLATLVCGCAYSFRSPSALSGKSIAIPPFESTTARYGIRDELTQALIQAFRDDNRLKVTDPNKADLLLLGTLTDYKKAPFTYDRQENLLSYKVSLFVDYSLKDTKTDSTLWSVKNYEAWATCGVAPDSEAVGIQGAIQNLTRDIVRRTVEEW